MMWGRVEVALTSLCALLLCCGPMLAGCRQVTFFPATLTLPAGGSATFFCNISMESDSSSEYSLNWYKETNHTHAQKIAEISWKTPPVMTGKYLLTNHTPSFKIKILNLQQNDSGSYYCGLINFFEYHKVMESNRSHLIVTAAPEKTNATDEPDMEEGKPLDHIKTILLSILLQAGAVVLLVFGYLIVMYRRGGVKKPPSENVPVPLLSSTVSAVLAMEPADGAATSPALHWEALGPVTCENWQERTLCRWGMSPSDPSAQLFPCSVAEISLSLNRRCKVPNLKPLLSPGLEGSVATIRDLPRRKSQHDLSP